MAPTNDNVPEKEVSLKAAVQGFAPTVDKAKSFVVAVYDHEGRQLWTKIVAEYKDIEAEIKKGVDFTKDDLDSRYPNGWSIDKDVENQTGEDLDADSDAGNDTPSEAEQAPTESPAPAETPEQAPATPEATGNATTATPEQDNTEDDTAPVS